MDSIPKTLNALLALAYKSCMGHPLPEAQFDALHQALLRDLAPSSKTSLATCLRHWMLWWSSERCTHLAGSARALEAYFHVLEMRNTPFETVSQRTWAIKRVLRILSWPDPEGKVILRGVERATGNLKRRAARNPIRVVPMGWPQIEHLIALTDRNRSNDVTTLAAILLFYETMARFDQVFGVSAQGKWVIAPAKRSDLRHHFDGGVIHLGPDSTGKGERDVLLSPVTMEWLERSFLLSPAGEGPLFRSKSGIPWTKSNWANMFKGLLVRHHLPGYSPSSLRWGRARDLLDKGIHALDVQEFAGWKQAEPVLRLIPRPSASAAEQTLGILAQNRFQLPELTHPRGKHCHTGDLFECAA